MSDVTLLLDSAMPHALVAVAREGIVVAERTLTTPQRHAEEIAGAVDACLREAGHVPRDVTRVVVGGGPGSFIGVRIALSFAQGFARALGIPALGFSTPLAIAASAALPHGDGLVVLDAKKGELYVLPVRHDDDGMRALGDPAPLSPAETAARFPSPAFLVGNGIAQLPFASSVPCEFVSGVRAPGALSVVDKAPPRPPLPDYRRAPDVRMPTAKDVASEPIRPI